MNPRGWWRRIVPGAALLLLVSGCSVNTKFVYRPDHPVPGAPTLPVKVAVLPFADGTENFTQRGSLLDLDHRTFNLARTGRSGLIDAITPELWAKMFAEDLAASGIFRSARFAFGPSETAVEDLLVDGTVLKADLSGSILKPSHFALALRARRKADDGVVWEKRVESVHAWTGRIADGCGLRQQCMADRFQAEIHKMVKAMFAEARADLVRTVAALSEGSGGALPPASRRDSPFIGVGMEIGVVNGALTVVRVMDGAPAQKGGLRAGDLLVAVDGRPTAGRDMAEVVDEIRGVEGTLVRLSILREGWPSPREFAIVRAPIGGKGPGPAAEPSVDETIEWILKEK